MREIKIHEVGLRDGLQMESEPIPTITKIEYTDQMIAGGMKIIQLGSFVHPGKVMQMADTDELFEHFNEPENKQDDVIFSGLVLNERGMERGMKCGVDMFCLGVSASETHSMKNTGMTVSDASDRIIKMAKEALSAGKIVQASIQSAFGCGFEGKIEEDKVLSIVKRYIDAGVKIISLADTAGHADPAQAERMFKAIHALDPSVETACHFHNTYGMGLANCLAAYNHGVTYFETAFGGLGGCPFTKIAAGNVATEDVVHMFQKMGILKDLDLQKLIAVPTYCSGFLIKDFPGFIYKSGPIKE
ncbi:MAG: hydroxymethylglutaryl-CoA lyase [Chlorobi bacterium]|nr:hydroxymethylglutaryl-CoA lyase [Chlorobiota bacterium]